MLHAWRTRSPGRLPPSVCVAALLALAAPTAAQTSPGEPTQWVVPRTPDGHPDLQGDWTNATLTPVQRPEGRDRVLTPEQVAEVEGRRRNFADSLARPSDPNREAPPRGGFGEAGSVGGYNYFYMDAGDRVAVFNGEPRSSIVVDPPDGRFPALTPEAERRREEEAERAARFGPFDNPENMTLSDRSIMSHGSHVPLLPNYAYNNNYTIVQTSDYVMILTEMIHDVRIIRLGERRPLPEDQYPWLGYSWGRWEGDTLVVETTNIPPSESNAQLFFPGGSEDMKVIERFTRPDEHTINYEFTVEDPATYVRSWSGELPFRRLDGRLYEYACHEGNYALPGILGGARAGERDSSGPSPSGATASRPPSPSGARLETVELTSRIFGNTRTLRVLLPAGYDEADGRRYPVLYMLDGQTLFDPADSYTPAVWEVDETVPHLIAEDAIEPLIVVGIDNPGLRERPNELLPWYDEFLTPPLPDPQGKRFPDFLANEVIPLIESRYRALGDPGTRGLAGTSYGGLMALYTVIHRPNLFGRLLIESPGFYVHDAAVLEEAEGHDPWPERIHVAVGTNEEGRSSCDPDDRSSEAVVDVLRLESILRGKGLGPDRLRVRIHPCAQHAEPWWGRRFPEALTFLYGRSSGDDPSVLLETR